MIKKILNLFARTQQDNASENKKENKVKGRVSTVSRMKAWKDSSQVEEYNFKVINWKKINFEQETDSDILRSYGEYDEGSYPLNLQEEYLPNLYFCSNTEENKLQFEIFSSMNLMHRPLYKNPEVLQSYFIDKHKTCFFYDKDISMEVRPNSELLPILTLEEFTQVVLPNLIPKLFVKLEKESKKRLYYNWEFYRERGHFRFLGSNLLCQLYDNLPYPNIPNNAQGKDLQFAVYANIEELANFAEGIQLEGLLWNAEFFANTYDNDIFEQIEPKSKNDKFKITPKSRYVCNELKRNPEMVEANLNVLNNWFQKRENIPPFRIL